MGRYKVNVNCVAFGLIKTRLTQPIETTQATIDVAGRAIKVGVQPQLLSTMDRLIPVGRGGTPEEAADAVYLFCTPESNYISGQVIVCGGGLLMYAMTKAAFNSNYGTKSANLSVRPC
jgi:3-oxoacyl-[acyl-carrier protein] reductase